MSGVRANAGRNDETRSKVLSKRTGGDTSKPLIGISMGDPAGIGAEVIIKALADSELRSSARFLIYGFDEFLAYAADLAEVNPFWFRKRHEEVGAVATGVVVADFDDLGVLNPLTRRETAEGGEASMRFLESAVSDLKRGMLDAVVTGPIHKTSWRLAGYKFPGHTEYLADRFRTKRITMAFVADKLRVALATTHIPLLELRNKFTIGTVFQPIELLNDALRDWFGVEHPRIAVAGLNPHASENGQFGDEEERIIIPAIEMAKLAGVDASGPYPADTLFCEHKRHTYDGVVAMYHDQGLIPVKLLAFDSSVNVTLGLPCIRTSVDHGTAFDIVGNNSANAGSMTAAIRLAIQLAEVKNKRLPSQTNGAPRS